MITSAYHSQGKLQELLSYKRTEVGGIGWEEDKEAAWVIFISE